MDIVERLRVIAQGMGSLGSIEREAADEIKRLRKALRGIESYLTNVTNYWSDIVRKTTISAIAPKEQGPLENRWDD